MFSNRANRTFLLEANIDKIIRTLLILKCTAMLIVIAGIIALMGLVLHEVDMLYTGFKLLTFQLACSVSIVIAVFMAGIVLNEFLDIIREKPVSRKPQCSCFVEQKNRDTLK